MLQQTAGGQAGCYCAHLLPQKRGLTPAACASSWKLSKRSLLEQPTGHRCRSSNSARSRNIEEGQCGVVSAKPLVRQLLRLLCCRIELARCHPQVARSTLNGCSHEGITGEPPSQLLLFDQPVTCPCVVVVLTMACHQCPFLCSHRCGFDPSATGCSPCRVLRRYAAVPP